MMITGVAPRSRVAMDSSMLQNTVIASARPTIRSAPGPTSHCSFTKRRQATPVTVAALIRRRRISRPGSGIRTNETMSANSVIPTVATKRQSYDATGGIDSFGATPKCATPAARPKPSAPPHQPRGRRCLGSRVVASASLSS